MSLTFQDRPPVYWKNLGSVYFLPENQTVVPEVAVGIGSVFSSGQVFDSVLSQSLALGSGTVPICSFELDCCLVLSSLLAGSGAARPATPVIGSTISVPRLSGAASVPAYSVPISYNINVASLSSVAGILDIESTSADFELLAKLLTRTGQLFNIKVNPVYGPYDTALIRADTAPVPGPITGDHVWHRSIRLSPLIEQTHRDFLSQVVSYNDRVLYDSPFSSYEPLDVDSCLLGIGLSLSDIPSLLDVFSEKLEDVDLYTLWNTVFSSVVDTTAEKTQKALDILDDEYERVILSNLMVEARRLNSVHSSSLVVSKAVAESNRAKQRMKIVLDSQGSLLTDAGKQFADRLNSHIREVTLYAAFVKNYYIHATDNKYNEEGYSASDALWPFKVLSFEQVALVVASLRNREWDKYLERRERSNVSKGLFVASQTVSGAMTGGQIGSSFGPYGTVIGAAIGAAVGFNYGAAYVMSEGQGDKAFTRAFLKVWGVESYFLMSLDPVTTYLLWRISF